jgi:DUF4097 and DUF4098 domain-containing protein YvlB
MKALFMPLVFLLCLATTAYAQDPVTVNLSDPSRPGLVRVNLSNGRIVVRGSSRQDVFIETGGAKGRTRPQQTRDGLRRIDIDRNGLHIEEQNNTITISAKDSANLELQVPSRTNLNLETKNGQILIEGVEGEMEISTNNGGITLNNVGGAIVAHSRNGRVVATLRDVAVNKATSFSSMNGAVDVTLPSTTKATLKMRSNNGAIWSDFDILLNPSLTPAVDDARNRGGRLRIETDKTLTGTINGGGPDIDLRTLNADIFIRKPK